MPQQPRSPRRPTSADAEQASVSAALAGASADQAGASADQAGASAALAGASADQARVFAEQVVADADSPPCGDVAKHKFPDLADGGIRDHDNIVVCGDAYYIYQLGADVSAAVTSLAEDFLEGKFAPEDFLEGKFAQDSRTRDLLCRHVSARLRRLPGEYVTKVLNTAFNDMRVDGLMNSLGVAFDAFERSYAVGQPDTTRPLVRAARHDLLRQILEIQRVFSDKGGGGMRFVVHQAGAELTEGLEIAAAPEVQCYAGIRIANDQIATLAALTHQPVEPIRARALKASAVRYVATEVAKFPKVLKALDSLTEDLDGLTEEDLGRLSDPLSDFRAASGEATASGDTTTPSDAVAEAHRLAVMSRQTALAPFRG
jgi:hypothetical protein